MIGKPPGVGSLGIDTVIRIGYHLQCAGGVAIYHDVILGGVAVPSKVKVFRRVGEGM
jgi:hypothetical protein